MVNCYAELVSASFLLVMLNLFQYLFSCHAELGSASIIRS